MRLLRFAVVVSLAISAACAPRARVHASPSPPAQAPAPAQPVTDEMAFIATAYCQDGKTASGAHTNRGMVAADPGVLPMGTRIRVSGLQHGRDGIYRVTDAGPRVQGRRIDVFMASCAEAKRFGRQHIRLAVIR
jgi:3D (Asp-Asp-Asp) domain-containing protein